MAGTKPAVILDLGSGFTKAGLATEENPSCIFPTFVGRMRRRAHAKCEDDGLDPALVADPAIQQRHKLSLIYPIDHGHVEDWLEMEEIFAHVFSTGLNIDVSEHPVLVTQPPMVSHKQREKMTELLLEYHRVPELTLQLQGLLALYSTGRTTGLTVEIGEGVTQVVPIFEGYTNPTGVQRSDFGGQELTLYLQRLLADQGYPLTTRDDFENVRLIKETLCYVAEDPAMEDLKDDLQVTYSLPDGMTLRDGTMSISLGRERFYCPEALFDPGHMRRDNPALMDMIWDSIQASPMEWRRALLGNVQLSGGSSLFAGLQARVLNELRSTAPMQARGDVNVQADDRRIFAVWLGAKSYFETVNVAEKQMHWMTREEWEEWGSARGHDKFSAIGH